MPVLTTSGTLDMTTLSRDLLVQTLANGTVRTATSTQYVVEYHINGYTVRHVFEGTGFVYPAGGGVPTGGTISSYSILDFSNDPVLALTGLTLTFSQLNAALAASDPQVFTNLIFGANDIITGGDDVGPGNILNGHGGDDQITGGTAGDTLSGGAGNDTINGGDESVSDHPAPSYDGIDGGDGDDVLSGGSGNDVIVGGSGSDQINGDAGNDYLLGHGGTITTVLTSVAYTPPYQNYATYLDVRNHLPSDRLIDDGVADTLNGGDGDDTIVAGLFDVVDGGFGNDHLDLTFIGRSSGLTLDMTGGLAALGAASGGSFTNVERITVRGSNHADVMTGSAGVETLFGGAGADTINGGDGNDVLIGATYAHNQLVGALAGHHFDDGAVDTLSGGEGNDTIVIGLGDSANGGGGTDILHLTLGALTHGVNLDLTVGDLWATLAAASGGSITGFETLSYLATTDFDDTVRLNGTGSFYLHGGNDTFHGDSGSQFVGGELGNDTIYTYGGNDRIWGGAGDDIVYAGDGSDYIYGDLDNNAGASSPTAGNDYLDGGAGNDFLYGGGGDDIIVTGAGADQGEGGDGFDTLDYSSSTSAISMWVETAYGPYNVPYTLWVGGGDALWDRFSGIERVVGTAFNDVMTDILDAVGGAGDDTLKITYSSGRLDGGDGNDILTAAMGNDTLLGGAGDDLLFGGSGNDLIDGGEGNDTLSYGEFYSIGAGMVVDLRLTGPQAPRSPGEHPAQSGGQDTLISVENLNGTNGGDTFHGNDEANILRGGLNGNASSVYPDGTVVPSYFDDLYGHGGDDQLFGDWADEQTAGTVYDGAMDRLYGGEGNDLAHGGAGNDKVYGEAGDDRLFGDGGNDEIFGGDGADLLTGGVGNDVLDGGDGRDTAVFSGARSAYTISTTNGVTTVNGPDGVDRLTNIERLQFSDGAFDLAGNRLPNEINGTPNADTLSGGAGADMILAGDGDDLITGGPGSDIIDGGAGVDTAIFAIGPVPYTVTVSNDVVTVVSGEGTDTLTNVERLRFGNIELAVSALGGGTALIGTTTGETLTGGAGDDLLVGLAGNDILNGGAGSDTANYANASAGVTARIDLQTASNDGDGGSDTFTSIENLTGSAFNDLLIGNGAANVLIGGAGRDVILGGGGDDIISGGADVPNELYGGAGNDTYIVENRSDSIFENAGEGIDTVLTDVSQINLAANIENLTYTGAGTFTGVGNAVNNIITGGTGRDVLLGLGGDDILIGGSGAANELYGGAGNDTYVLDVADSIIEGVGDGVDTVQLRGLRNYTLGSNVENGTVVGAGDFMLNGNALDNVLTGGDGNDTLQGGAGNDTLNGGAGIDTITYILSTAGVTARLDLGRATNDGLGGTDTFTGFENLTGSNLRDTLMGNAGNNVIDGAIGNDVLLGFDGDDILIGGSGGGVNEMYGGRGDDLYIVDAADTLIELAGEGIDTVQTTMGNFTLKANIEHLTYVGPGNFGGTGNAENNTITGGAGHDTLAGLGGDDLLIGGAGNDLALLQGVRANYSFTQIEGGWRVVDSVAGRDGTDVLQGIESVRFANGEVLVLSSLIPPAPAAAPEVMALLSDKTLFDDAFVLPALDDDALVLPGLAVDKGWADLPQVLPTADALFAEDAVLDTVAPSHVLFHGHADGADPVWVRDWLV